MGDTYSFKAFGETVATTGTTGAYQRYGGAVGYQLDHNGGGWWARARSLQPSQGRWMSRDRLGVEGGDGNLYRYVANRPTVLVDPSGLQSDSGAGPFLLGNRFCQVFVMPRQEIKLALCHDRANAMHSAYHPTFQHFCHHLYAHCVLCCILTRSEGARCATAVQAGQIATDFRNWFNEASATVRWKGCHRGIAIARNRAFNEQRCATACLSPRAGFPWPRSPRHAVNWNRAFTFGGRTLTCGQYLTGRPRPFPPIPGRSCPAQ